MKLSKKAALDIATLYNTITVSERMVADAAPMSPAVFAWRSSLFAAVQILRQTYGISPVGYQRHDATALLNLRLEADRDFKAAYDEQRAAA